MNRLRFAGLTTFALLVVYVAYYLVNSPSGYYKPKAFGAYRDGEGNTILASKGFGESWVPQRPGREQPWFEDVYAPLVFLDRLIWHKTRRETGPRKSYGEFIRR